jgi:hypothetical protein
VLLRAPSCQLKNATSLRRHPRSSQRTAARAVHRIDPHIEMLGVLSDRSVSNSAPCGRVISSSALPAGDAAAAGGGAAATQPERRRRRGAGAGGCRPAAGH